MNLPDALVTGRAVLAVRGVLMACSMVPGRPDWVLGLTNPDKGRPDWVIGLHFSVKKQYKVIPIGLLLTAATPAISCFWLHRTAGVGPAPWLVPGSLSDVPGPRYQARLYHYSLMNKLCKQDEAKSNKKESESKLTGNLSYWALIQHHLSNPLLVNFNFIDVDHLCQSTRL